MDTDERHGDSFFHVDVDHLTTAMQSRLVAHLERRAVLWPGLAVVVDARGGDVGVAEPLLHLGDVGLTPGDKLVYVNDVIKGKLMESEKLAEQAANSAESGRYCTANARASIAASMARRCKSFRSRASASRWR